MTKRTLSGAFFDDKKPFTPPALWGTMWQMTPRDYDMTKSLLLTAMALGVATLAGCATTSTLKAQDCPHANWHDIGYQDGLRGASSQAILKHSNTCQSQATPDRKLWEEGRQKGLLEYCTPTNAYNLGRMGRTLTGICEHNLEELHRANLMGLEQYEISERINRLHYGYGGYLHPWFGWWY